MFHEFCKEMDDSILSGLLFHFQPFPGQGLVSLPALRRIPFQLLFQHTF